MKDRTRKRTALLLLTAVMLLLAVAKPLKNIILWQKNGSWHSDYVVRHYKIKNKKFPHRLKIALITDFHDRDTADIAEKVRAYNPHVILLAGDIFERMKPTLGGPVVHPLMRKVRDFVEMSEESYDIKNSRELIAQLGKIAPVYISRGNHERYYLPQDLLAIVNTNARLLDNSDSETTLNGMKIRIGGLSSEANHKWLREFSKKQGLKILMCHHPEYYLNFIKDTPNDQFDLIVAGHAHGGQWRIFDKGLYAYGQGFFPKYTRGIHGKMVISAGISNSIFVRRINNPEEIVFIEINKD